MVDSKGYEASPVILKVSIEIVEPEEEEEEQEIRQGPDFVPDWDKFYKDQNKGKDGEGDQEENIEEIIIEEPVNPALIA